MDKQAIRERVWDDLEDAGVARFPYPPHGRIPNFAGAEVAASQLAEQPAWRQATVVKTNPDAPQLPVRRAALREGKTVYVAVPRLREEACFYRLDPDRIPDTDAAATIGGASDAGEQVRPADLEPVDLVVSGSVAVTSAGTRIGKGEGYSDLEFAILREFGLVGQETPTATTVHTLQVRDVTITPQSHDVPMDLVVTPDGAIDTGASEKPSGLDWSELDRETRAAIPILDQLSP